MNGYSCTKYTMPSHGLDIIDGIPVTLKDNIMYSCVLGTSKTPIRLGTYVEKKAVWEPSDAMTQWLSSYREELVSRSRK